MATVDIVGKFAEQAIKVERVLQERGIHGTPGRVIFVLRLANTLGGVPQKTVVKRLALPKDVVSKLIGSLVQTDLLSQERQEANSREKWLSTSNSGRELLSRLGNTLRPPRPASPRRVSRPHCSRPKSRRV